CRDRRPATAALRTATTARKRAAGTRSGTGECGRRTYSLSGCRVRRSTPPLPPRGVRRRRGMRGVGGGAGGGGEDGRVRGPAARRSPAPPRGGTGAVLPGAAPRAAGPRGSGRTGGHRNRRCGKCRKQHGPTIGGIRLSRYVGSGGVRADARQTPVPVRARRRQGRGRTAHSPPDTAKGTRPSGGRPAPTVRNRGGAAIMPYRPMAGRSSPEAEHTLRYPKAAV